MRAVCVIVRNPLDPLRSREFAVLRRRVRIRALAPRDVPVVAILNGRPVLPAWGAQAEALAWEAPHRRLTLSEPMTFAAEGTHYLGLRRPDGSLCGPILVTAGPLPEQIVLAEAPDFEIVTGSEMERTQVSFGAGTTWAVLAKVADIKAKSLVEYTLQAVVEDPSGRRRRSTASAAGVANGATRRVWTAWRGTGRRRWRTTAASRTLATARHLQVLRQCRVQPEDREDQDQGDHGNAVADDDVRDGFDLRHGARLLHAATSSIGQQFSRQSSQRMRRNQGDHAVATEAKPVHPVGQPISASTNSGFKVRRASEVSRPAIGVTRTWRPSRPFTGVFANVVAPSL